MNFYKALLIVALAAIMAPGIASATHLVRVDGFGDCDGWFLGFQIHFRSTVFEVNAEYLVELVDGEDNLLESFSWSGVLTRPPLGPQAQFFTYVGEWTVFAPAGSYFVRGWVAFSAPWEGGVDEGSLGFESALACATVATEEQTWSAIKELFR
jgi:hypothetical protein